MTPAGVTETALMVIYVAVVTVTKDVVENHAKVRLSVCLLIVLLFTAGGCWYLAKRGGGVQGDCVNVCLLFNLFMKINL